MVLVPDKTHKIPLSAIVFTEYGLSDLLDNAVARKREVAPNWTDESPTDPGMQLLSVFSSLTHLMHQTIEQAARNASLLTADRREAVRTLARPLGYEVKEQRAATVSVQFTFEVAHPELTIPARTRLSTGGVGNEQEIIFETIADTLVLEDAATASVACIQGESVLNEVLGASDGSARQKFYLKRRPVIWGSESIQVFDGTTWVSWTRMSDLVESTNTSKHYTVTIDNEGWVYIQFGDGEFGAVPVVGTNNVRASYRVGGGSAGNVAANAITELLTPIDHVLSVTNLAAATGGADPETIRRAKTVALAKWRAQLTGMTEDGIKALLLDYVSDTYGAIAAVGVVAVDKLTIDVRFVPATDGVPVAGFKQEVQEYLNREDIAAILTEVKVSDPEFLPVDYDVEIWIADGYQRDQVIEYVRQAIVRFGSPTYRDADGLYPNQFGQIVALSKLSREIQNVAGIDYLVINSPATDLSMPAYQIRSINSIEITANQGGTSVSRTILNFEL